MMTSERRRSVPDEPRRSARERRSVDHGPFVSRLAARAAIARDSAFGARRPVDEDEPQTREEAMASPNREPVGARDGRRDVVSARA